MRLFNYVLNITFHSRRRWTDPLWRRMNRQSFRQHERYSGHFVWGRLSILYGQPHLEPVRVCSACNEEIRCLSAGDESLDWCESCQQLEPDTHEVTMEQYEELHS